MKINVGDYVRTNDGYCGTVRSIWKDNIRKVATLANGSDPVTKTVPLTEIIGYTEEEDE